MTENLAKWLEANKMTASDDQELSGVVIVEEIGKFLLIQPKEGIVIDNDFSFVLYDEELDMIEDGVVNFLLFEFGGRFYYSKIKSDKNKYGEIIYKPEFNDFKYLGETTDETIVKFTHLGVHDEYEILNGSSSSELWSKKAKFLKHEALGCCNKNTLSGALAFQTNCQKYGLKPIIGETITVAVNYDENEKIQETHELKLYVINQKGWKNLLMINKAINVDYNQFIPDDLLFEYSDGLACVFSKESELNFHKHDTAFAKKLIKRYKKYFDYVYFQIDTVEYTSESLFRNHLESIDVYISNFSSILQPILINDSYYLDLEEGSVKSLLNKVAGRAEAESKNQYYKDFNQTIESYSEWLDIEPLMETILLGIENASEFADLVDFKINTGERKLPAFEVEDVNALFYEKVNLGFHKKFGHLPNKEYEVYKKRLDIECNLIVPNGLCDYFMILWDITEWCHNNDILVGSGRGSVCGSLVAFVLEITSVDPLKYGLMFERFLNETRVSGERAKAADSMPDVDVDFPTEHRDAVKEYIKNKYGAEFTCSIGTYTRMKLKTCIKDFAKIKGYPFDYTNKLTKDIDDQIDYTWGDLFAYGCKSKTLYKFIQENPDIVYATKSSLMNCKAESVHPSAVIIVPKHDLNGEDINAFEWMPIKSIDGVLVSEWEGKYIDKSGFLKEDILGLSQLDKFDAIMKLIKKNTKEEIILDDIPFDDEEVFRYFKKGWCEDIFQFGTTGLMNYCRQVKPDSLENLIAMTSLFRPGPMELNAHQDFADIKNGKKKPSFDLGMEKITGETYGLYVYQEQIMKAVVVGGLTEVESDILRTTIKKKDIKTLSSYGDKFKKGYEKLLEANGIKNPKAYADSVWAKLLAFSGYGFNKSHAAAYSIMSYWSQWFKVNHPLEFWTVAMNFSKETEIPFRISELVKTGVEIEIRPPDVNFSDSIFTCDAVNNRIFFSLTKIKGCGEVAVKFLIEERNRGGKFFDFDEFISRVPSKVNKSNIVNLIIAGAFDLIEKIKYPKNRKLLLERYLTDYKKSELPDKFKTEDSDTNSFWITEQKLLTGYGEIDYKSILENKSSNKRVIGLYKESFEITSCKEGTEVTVVGKCIYANLRNIKNGKMIQLSIDSNNTVLLVTLWPDAVDKFNLDDSNYIDFFKEKIMAVNGIVKMDKFKGQKCIYSTNKTKIILLS